MTRPLPLRRSGYTMLEMVVVLAVILVIGGVILPTLAGLTGNMKVKGAGDAVKARLLEARTSAMEQGRPYIFSVSTDGTQVQYAPDDSVEPELGSDGQPTPGTVVSEAMPSEVTVKPGTGGGQLNTTSDGHLRLVTFQSDGTCTEDSPDILVQENGVTGVVLKVRALTGAVTISPPSRNGGMQ